MMMTMPREPKADLSDDDLMRAYAAGDANASRVLSERHLPRVFAQAMRMLHNRAEAEDVAQEVMLRLWRAAPDWRAGEAQLSTWAYRVTSNACIDRLRKARMLPLEAAPDLVDGRAGVEREMQDAARVRALQSALMELPERQCEAVTLRHIEGLGNEEIAQIMGLGVRAVESLTARGKRALAAQLAGRRGELGYDDD